MLAPERRSRPDLIAAAAVALVVVVLVVVMWARSEARSTTSVQAATPATPLVGATSVPTSLTQIWQAPSAATVAPVVVGGGVVTADGSEVSGRNPASGDVLWHYSRDLPLCAATGEWNRAVAVYRSGRGCSDVTSLEGSTGARGPQRDSEADSAVALAGNSTYLASVGSSRMEVWRSDLVRTLEFGAVHAPVNPNSQPRTGCTLRSVAMSAQRIAAAMSCPGDQGDRLSLLDPSPEDPTKPTERGSALLGTTGARVIAVTAERTAVYLPGTDPRIALYDNSATLLSSFPLADAALAPAPDATHELVEATTATASVVTWWTGSAVVALSADELTMRWSLPKALGPGAEMAGELLVPVPGGIAGISSATGSLVATIPVDRGNSSVRRAIELSVAGGVVLEQRGGTVTALK